MTSIYIHIPFCRQKCHYCNFYSLATNSFRTDFIKALKKEIAIRKSYLENEVIDTVYFGGGTPSLLSRNEIDQIFDTLAKHFTFSGQPEITFEANPDDLMPEIIRNLYLSPVNRLSIGIQSFRDEDLKYLNRIHSASVALRAIEDVQHAGFTNLTIDLIFGIPTLSDENWKANLNTFTSLKIPHLSAYALTVEPRTALDVLIRKGKIQPVDEKKAADQFHFLMIEMDGHGYSQYEISNFCTPGNLAKHNTNYWKGGKYLGLGPSAHSFDGDSRQWNVGHLSQYIAGIKNNAPNFEKELLTIQQRYNEYVMVTLRTIWGMSEVDILDRFGKKYRDYFIQEVRRFVAQGHVKNHEGKYTLSNQGKLFADGISAELFWPL